METKKGSTGMNLLDQGLTLLFMMHTKRPFSGKEICSSYQQVLLERNISIKACISSIYGYITHHMNQ